MQYVHCTRKDNGLKLQLGFTATKNIKYEFALALSYPVKLLHWSQETGLLVFSPLGFFQRETGQGRLRDPTQGARFPLAPTSTWLGSLSTGARLHHSHHTSTHSRLRHASIHFEQIRHHWNPIDVMFLSIFSPSPSLRDQFWNWVSFTSSLCVQLGDHSRSQNRTFSFVSSVWLTLPGQKVTLLVDCGIPALRICRLSSVIINL